MHPKVVLPAIEATLKTVVDQIHDHKELAARLEPGQSIVSLNPHVSGPGNAVLPNSAKEFKFWTIPDEQTFSTFMEHLAIQMDALAIKHTEFQKLPEGYRIVRYVLRFETHCKFSSWMAIQNVGPHDMEWTRDSYRRIGLNEEATALELAEKAWYDAGGHDGNGYEAAGEAYRSVSNPHQDEDDRWFHILGILRDTNQWITST